MSKKSQKIEDLIEAFNDERLLQSLVPRLAAAITPIVNDLFKSFTQKLEDSLQKFASELVDSKFKTVKKSLDDLNKENMELKSKIQDLEIYSKSYNLIINGIPETYAETVKPSVPTTTLPNPQQTSNQMDSQSLEEKIINLCSSRLGIQLSSEQIDKVHRLKVKGIKEKYRPTLIRFTNKKIRDLIYSTRTKLKSTTENNQPIYINEHLTQTNSKLFSTCRKLLHEKKVSKTWTSGGYVYCKITSSPVERPKLISSFSDIDQL